MHYGKPSSSGSSPLSFSFLPLTEFLLIFSSMANSSVILGGFGLPAAAGLLLFFGEVPRVRNDILQRIPVLGPYWRREIAPEDNVSPTTQVNPLKTISLLAE